jgi:DNA-binding response OmpR family regulator
LAEQKRILIIEDGPFNAIDIAQSARDAGYEVTGVVLSGEEAVELANPDRPDLVLTGIGFSGDMNGRDAALEIRKLYGTSVIFVSAYGDAKHAEVAKLNAPADVGYLVKPFKNSDLLAEIERVLFSE